MAKGEKKKSKKADKAKPKVKKTKAPKKKSVRLSRAEKKTVKVERKKATKRDIKNMGFFERMRYKRKLRRDREARRRAEDLATLPKEPIRRFFAHLHPKRVFHYWFSWRGLKKILKIGIACILLGVIAVGGLFLYYKKDIADIKLDDIVISDTVNTYLDRNGVVLWEDTGTENYRLVVQREEMSDYIRQATVALEDKNFYSHPGVDFTGLTRAFISTLSHKEVQGGSTLTQQLIKQIYFSDEAQSENRGGIARKIKELILAVELEKMYDKEQILTMYLNESPYGGRRNGVESASQTYFGKSAKDLTIAEAALLASIPKNPAVYNPYNSYGNEALLERQQYAIDRMVEMGYITSEEAEEAKKVAILDKVKPESTQYENIKAPHFVLEVRKQLENKYGISTMRSGGFTIKTTLDYRAQQIAEDAIRTGVGHLYKNGTDNLAIVSIDVETSQIVAMVGSTDFTNPTYGELNVTTDSIIEPGSSIKPILDYAPLFMQREGQNFGPGTILKDENIDKLYCNNAVRNCMTNATNTFYGNVTIRFSLGHSLNIAAVKALYINGIDNSLKIARELGDVTYCQGRADYGLSIAIGSGCGVRMVEHANAYASLARGGSYKDLAYILEVKNSSGDVLEAWKDTPAKQVVDPQVAYMISNILSDDSARWASAAGFNIPGVWTATKTGTTTTTNSSVVKDSLIESYSTAVSTFVWNGNHDGSGFAWSGTGSGDPVRYVVHEYMERVHHEVYGPDGRWNTASQPARPAGIQVIKGEIWPSWYNSKTSGTTEETLQFNKFNHKLAAACTNANYIESVTVTKSIDPVTKQESWDVPAGYDRENPDDCSYVAPHVSASRSGSSISVTVSGSAIIGGKYTVTTAKGASVSGTINSVNFTPNYTIKGDEGTITITVTDKLYGTSDSTQINIPIQPSDSSAS